MVGGLTVLRHTEVPVTLLGQTQPVKLIQQLNGEMEPHVDHNEQKVPNENVPQASTF